MAATRGLDALALMGAQYYELLADRTTLLLQLQGFAACGDSEVRDLVRARLAHMWDGCRYDGPRPGDGESRSSPLRHAARQRGHRRRRRAMGRGVRTRIQAGLFEHHH
ncbi:hypothetical protein [Nocardia pseudovaccinii]|uniref:hypothetical protein n=1 Tax=Nocardia pseudovaccinii TaxID=189540 RepID=UPI000A3F0337|nr:hypothetical protein [Nocardia pseudovaccinii]